MKTIPLSIDLNIEHVSISSSSSRICPTCATNLIYLITAAPQLHNFRVNMVSVQYEEETNLTSNLNPVIRYRGEPLFRCVSNHYFIFSDLSNKYIVGVNAQDFNEVSVDMPLQEQIQPKELSIGEGI